MDRGNVKYMDNWAVLSYIWEQINVICRKMGRAGDYTKWNKPDSSRQVSHFPSYVILRKEKKSWHENSKETSFLATFLREEAGDQCEGDGRAEKGNGVKDNDHSVLCSWKRKCYNETHVLYN